MDRRGEIQRQKLDLGAFCPGRGVTLSGFLQYLFSQRTQVLSRRPQSASLRHHTHAASGRSKEWAALTQWLSCLALPESSPPPEPPQKTQELRMGQNWPLSLEQWGKGGPKYFQVSLMGVVASVT